MSRRFLPDVLFLLVVLRLGAALAGDRPDPPPPWIRYNDDYSFLADRSQRTDPFDFLKYISLGNAGYLSLGGEARERFESYTNETFDSAFPTAEKKDDNSFFLQRYLFLADYHPNDSVRVFGELQSS